MSQLVDVVQTARSAAERYAWREAHEAYTSTTQSDLTPADLELFAEAAWWSGRPDEAISLRERSYGGFSSGGDRLSAARLALKLADDHVGRGLFAVAHGWFANAERLLEGQPESAEHGVLMMMRGIKALFVEGDLPGAISEFDGALELSHRLGDRDTQRVGARGQRTSARQVRRRRARARAARRGDRVGRVRRAPAVLDRARLLRHDQLLSGPRRLPPRRRMDGGREPLVRSPRRHRLPRRMSDSPGGDHADARRVAPGGGAGDRSVRGALRLRPPHHGRRLLRDR